MIDEKQEKRFQEILDMLQNGEEVFDKLTPEELKQFEDFIKDTGNLAECMKEWTPWWERELVL
jgi:uncharacterized protein YbaP (TraB family)